MVVMPSILADVTNTRQSTLAITWKKKPRITYCSIFLAVVATQKNTILAPLRALISAELKPDHMPFKKVMEMLAMTGAISAVCRLKGVAVKRNIGSK
jgi:hypothetical protein